MICHLINKAVVKQNCIEALNQHAQPLKKSCPLEFHLKLRQSAKWRQRALTSNSWLLGPTRDFITNGVSSILLLDRPRYATGTTSVEIVGFWYYSAGAMG